jgi:hypothetical protein
VPERVRVRRRLDAFHPVAMIAVRQLGAHRERHRAVAHTAAAVIEVDEVPDLRVPPVRAHRKLSSPGPDGCSTLLPLLELPRRALWAIDDDLRRVGFVSQIDAVRDPADCASGLVYFLPALLATQAAPVTLAGVPVETARSAMAALATMVTPSPANGPR